MPWGKGIHFAQTLKQTVEDVKAGSLESSQAAGVAVGVVLVAAILRWVGAVSSNVYLVVADEK